MRSVVVKSSVTLLKYSNYDCIAAFRMRPLLEVDPGTLPDPGSCRIRVCNIWRVADIAVVWYLTHSLTAARNRLWVVAPSMLTGHQQEPMRQQQWVRCPGSTVWLIHVVRGLPAGRFQSWCGVSPDLESTASFSACVPVYCQTNDECGRRWSDNERLWYWVCLPVVWYPRLLTEMPSKLICTGFGLHAGLCGPCSGVSESPKMSDCRVLNTKRLF